MLSRGYNETSALKLVGDRHADLARVATVGVGCGQRVGGRGRGTGIEGDLSDPVGG